jgi:hypothetical protein
MVANFFGDPDRARRSKEVKFNQDLEALVSEMQCRKFHVINKDGHFVPAPPKKTSKKKINNSAPEPTRSAVIDIFTKGAEEWNGKFTDWIKSTTYDPALGGYPSVSESSSTGGHDTTLDNGTVFDTATTNPITCDSYIDLHGNEETNGITGMGSLGGGGDFDGVE